MNRASLYALLGALPLCATATAQTTPLYAVTDLGPTTLPGAGLLWQPRQPPLLAPSNWPSSGGTHCLSGTPYNYIYAEYGAVAVGATCVAPIGEHAAKWTISGSTVTLTDLGTLPGALPDVDGIHAAALGFNSVGDIVGYSDSTSGTYHPGSPYVAEHAFLYNNGSWTDLGAIAGPEYGSNAEAVNDSHEIVGNTNTVSTATGAVLTRAFVYIGGTMYNLTFYLVGGPTVLLSDAYWIDCQGNIAAVGTPAARGNTHSYLLVRQGAARTTCTQ